MKLIVPLMIGILTSRAQPPSWIRLWTLLNEAQNSGMSLTSVAGGFWKSGNCDASAGFIGPGSVLLDPSRALIAPSAGRSGLPKPAAWAAPVTSRNPAMDNDPRRCNGFISQAPSSFFCALLSYSAPSRYPTLILCQRVGGRRTHDDHRLVEPVAHPGAAQSGRWIGRLTEGRFPSERHCQRHIRRLRKPYCA